MHKHTHRERDKHTHSQRGIKLPLRCCCLSLLCVCVRVFIAFLMPTTQLRAALLRATLLLHSGCCQCNHPTSHPSAPPSTRTPRQNPTRRTQCEAKLQNDVHCHRACAQWQHFRVDTFTGICAVDVSTGQTTVMCHIHTVSVALCVCVCVSVRTVVTFYCLGRT